MPSRVNTIQNNSELFEQYRDVFIRSVFVSFGLDALLFRNLDQEGGSVDTLHNAGKGIYSNQYGEKSRYDQNYLDEHCKEKKFESERRKHYDKHEKFIQTGRRYKTAAERGELRDGYTGQKLSSHSKFDRDHIQSTKEIEYDRGRVLARVDGPDLANSETNLTPTERSINRSKKEAPMEKFIPKVKEKQKDLEFLNEQEEREGKLNDRDRKRRDNLQKFSRIDDDRAAYLDQRSRKHTNKTLNEAYYFNQGKIKRCKSPFYPQLTEQTLKSAFRMGTKQALGVVILEIWNSFQRELPHILKKWRDTEGWGKEVNLKPFLKDVGRILQNAYTSVKRKWGKILKEFKNGAISGILSSLTTTIINIFKTTARNIAKLIRSFWSTIVASIEILRSGKYSTRAEKSLAISRLLSVGITSALDPIISECVDKYLTPYIPVAWLRGILSNFSGAFCSGVLSVTFVYVIDNSPIIQKIIRVGGDIVAQIVRFFGEYFNLTYEALKVGAKQLTNFVFSTPVRLLSGATSPLPLETTRQLQKSMNKQEKLLSSLNNHFEETDKKIDFNTQQLEIQKEAFSDIQQNIVSLSEDINVQFEDIKKTTNVIIKKIDKLTDEVKKTRREFNLGVKKLLDFSIQQTFNKLLTLYKGNIESLKDGVVPDTDALLSTIDTARNTSAWIKSSLQDIDFDDGQDISCLLSAWLLSLGIEIDVLLYLRKQDIVRCRPQLEEISGLINKALRFYFNQTLYQQSRMENFLKIRKYVLLGRSVKQFLKVVDNNSHHINDLFFNPIVSKTMLFVWNDGLEKLRNIVPSNENGGASLTDDDNKIISSLSEHKREEYQPLFDHIGPELTLGDLKDAVGIPRSVRISNDRIFEILEDLPILLKGHRVSISEAIVN